KESRRVLRGGGGGNTSPYPSLSGQPPSSSRRRHLYPDLGVGGPAGAQPGLQAPGRRSGLVPGSVEMAAVAPDRRGGLPLSSVASWRSLGLTRHREGLRRWV